MSVRTTGLKEWLADLERAPDAVLDEAEKVTSKGALQIKRGWAQRWTGLAHLPHLPRTVGYDPYREGDTVGAVIGPDPDKLQGSIAHMIELGSVNSAPHPGGFPALEAEAPNYERYLADAAVKPLEGR